MVRGEIPGLNEIEGLVGGDVDLSGGNSNIAMRESPIVSILSFGLIVLVMAYHPPIVIATGMMAFRHLITPSTLGHAADLNTFKNIHQWEVYIQTDALGKTFGKHALGNLTNQGAKWLKVGIVTMIAE